MEGQRLTPEERTKRAVAIAEQARDERGNMTDEDSKVWFVGYLSDRLVTAEAERDRLQACVEELEAELNSLQLLHAALRQRQGFLCSRQAVESEVGQADKNPAKGVS
jgi:hypothetical protein